MQHTAEEVASIVGGTLEGDGSVMLTQLSRIEEGAPGSLSFLHSPKYFEHLYTSEAGAVLVPKDFQPREPVTPTLIYVENPYASFGIFLHQEYRKRMERSGKHGRQFIAEDVNLPDSVYLGPNVTIEAGAQIAEGVHLYANVFIGKNVQIGEGSVLFPNVVVYEDSVIGEDCILHAGVIVGADGFGFLQDENHVNQKIPQLGNVILEDEVEIGANTVIDRATLGSTILRRGVKIDNLVQVAHNCEIGEQTVVAAQSGISGSSYLGNNCMIGGQVGVAGHLKLAEFTQIGAQSGISKSIRKPGQALRGSPAQPLKQQLKLEASIRQIPHLIQRINELENQLAQLKEPTTPASND